MFKSMTPILWSKSVEDSVAFYESKLGFTLAFAMRDPEGKIEHAMIAKDAVSLMVGYQRGEDGEKVTEGLGGGPELYFDLEAVDGYYASVQRAGAPITVALADQYWGDRTFTVTDPDGYRLTFSQTVRAFDPSQPMLEAVPA